MSKTDEFLLRRSIAVWNGLCAPGVLCTGTLCHCGGVNRLCAPGVLCTGTLCNCGGVNRLWALPCRRASARQGRSATLTTRPQLCTGYSTNEQSRIQSRIRVSCHPPRVQHLYDSSVYTYPPQLCA